jgi:hypothetical protein
MGLDTAVRTKCPAPFRTCRYARGSRYAPKATGAFAAIPIATIVLGVFAVDRLSAVNDGAATPPDAAEEGER